MEQTEKVNVVVMLLKSCFICFLPGLDYTRFLSETILRIKCLITDINYYKKTVI